jgi:predicted patatin/cPLA2 family phospholipase
VKNWAIFEQPYHQRICCKVDCFMGEDANHFFFLAVIKSNYNSLEPNQLNYKHVMKDFKHFMKDFKHVMKDFKHVMKDFKHVMKDFKHVMKDFKHFSIKFLNQRICCKVDCFMGEDANHFFFLAVIKSNYNSLEPNQFNFKHVMKDFKHVMKDFKHFMKDFKHVMKDFKHVMKDFKHVMKDFKHFSIKFLNIIIKALLITLLESFLKTHYKPIIVAIFGFRFDLKMNG